MMPWSRFRSHLSFCASCVPCHRAVYGLHAACRACSHAKHPPLAVRYSVLLSERVFSAGVTRSVSPGSAEEVSLGCSAVVSVLMEWRALAAFGFALTSVAV